MIKLMLRRSKQRCPVENINNNADFDRPLDKEGKFDGEKKFTYAFVACENVVLNNVTNIEVKRLPSEEISPLIIENKISTISDIDYNFSTLFVDPPRCGLDDATIDLAQSFDNIIYISCNPETLKENLSQLVDSHEIVAFAIFDQFPYTHHIECGAILRRKK